MQVDAVDVGHVSAALCVDKEQIFEYAVHHPLKRGIENLGEDIAAGDEYIPHTLSLQDDLIPRRFA